MPSSDPSHANTTARPHTGLDILAATTGAAAYADASSVHHHHLQQSLISPTSRQQSQSQLPVVPSPTAQAPSGPQPSHRRTANGAVKRTSDDSAEASDERNAGRQRITRACDRCNQQRTKCSGSAPGLPPCENCRNNKEPCTFERAQRKRGKTSAKDRRKAEQDAQAASTAGNPPPPNLSTASTGLPAATQPPPLDDYAQASAGTPRDFAVRSANPLASPHMTAPTPDSYGLADLRHVPGYFPSGSEAGFDQYQDVQHPQGVADGPRIPTPQQRRQLSSHPEARLPPPPSPGGASMAGWLTGLNSAQSPGRFSPGRFSIPSMPSPGNAFFNLPNDQLRPSPDLKYPVLKPIVSHLQGIIPMSLACELLEMYFASSTTAFQHPTSSYVVAYVFRKNSFLTQQNPRLCSPALLASMIWIAAQESDAAFLKSSVTSKATICAKLAELTINLLRPLVHRSYSAAEDPMAAVINNIALGGFGTEVNMMVPGGRHGSDSGHMDASVACGEIDDLVTYIHLATVVSASEAKAASMRWWNVIYSLVKEYRFNRELPRSHNENNSEGSINSPAGAIAITEESREERRRVWWLVYTVDKHLALCYNQPLNIRDCECYNLLRPVQEAHWQAGDRYAGPQLPDDMRPRGISYKMSDHGIFGFFTPLMTLLGEAIDLQQIRYRTRSQYPMPQVSDESAALIRSRVDMFLESVHEFRNLQLPQGIDQGILPSSNDLPRDAQPQVVNRRVIPEHNVQTIVATSYASYIARVIKVLVSGKWDPLSLLDESFWISSEDFVTATTTAVEGAEFLSSILSFDSALAFMPWFFGIYLLHGSFLLLLFADRLGADVGERYTSALELSARATESCVVTLNTEYQRNFRKVMRSALSQVQGRIAADETSAKRREVLGLYRWTPEGRGLAL